MFLCISITTNISPSDTNHTRLVRKVQTPTHFEPTDYRFIVHFVTRIYLVFNGFNRTGITCTEILRGFGTLQADKLILLVSLPSLDTGTAVVRAIENFILF